MPSPRCSLSRSCQACIKAKRRCTLETPSCGRCRMTHARCVYTNSVVDEVLASAMPAMPSDPSTWSWIVRDDTAGPDHDDHGFHLMNRWRESAFMFANQYGLLDRLRPRFDPVALTLDKDTTQYIVGAIRTAGQDSLSICVHKRLVISMSRPPAVDNVLQLVMKASQSTDLQTRDSLANELEARTRTLIAYTRRTKPDVVVLLQCVQTLLAAEIVLAIGPLSHDMPDTAEIARRTKQLRTLSSWCWTLWEQAPWTLPDSVSAEQSWLFAESVRRTLLIVHLLCDIFSVLHTGVFRFSGFVSTLPYDTRTWLWEGSQAPCMGPRVDGRDESMEDLQSFRQLVNSFENGQIEAGKIDRFEALLLVACRGFAPVSKHFDITY